MTREREGEGERGKGRKKEAEKAAARVCWETEQCERGLSQVRVSQF